MSKSRLIKFLVRNRIPLIVLTSLVGLVYFNSLGNAFVSDDLQAILENKNLGNFRSLNLGSPTVVRDIFYHLIFTFFGQRPLFYHLFNLGFHFGSVIVLYALLMASGDQAIAFLAAAIFAVHPLQTEAVTWISGGTYAQYSFFLLLSLLAFTLSQCHRSFYWLSLIAFTLCLLSSDKAIVFLPILIAFSFTFSSLKKDIRRLVPFVLLTLFGLWRLIVQVGERVTTLRDIHYEAPVVYNPLLQIPIAISSYLELIFWPKNLTLYHTEMSFTQTQYLMRLGVFLAVVGLAIWGLVKNRKLFFWLTFFFIALSPTLTPWGLSWIVAERYAYLSAIGIYVLIAYFFKRVGETVKIKPLLQVGLTIVILLLAVRTVARNRDWRTADDLWLAAAKTSPSSHVNHNNLGDLYARKGQPEQAIAEFKTAIKLKPNYADAFHNLANTYKEIGMDKEALVNYQEAIKYNPALWQSHQNTATIYFQQGLYDQAAVHLLEAVKINPQNTFLHSNLGAVYLTVGDKTKAKAEFLEALRLEPTNEFAKRGLEGL